MGVLNFIKRIFVWWDDQTIGTQLWTWRKGKKVGEDAAGNIYYTNAAGDRSWVIYNGDVEGIHNDDEATTLLELDDATLDWIESIADDDSAWSDTVYVRKTE